MVLYVNKPSCWAAWVAFDLIELKSDSIVTRRKRTFAGWKMGELVRAPGCQDFKFKCKLFVYSSRVVSLSYDYDYWVGRAIIGLR